MLGDVLSEGPPKQHSSSWLLSHMMMTTTSPSYRRHHHAYDTNTTGLPIKLANNNHRCICFYKNGLNNNNNHHLGEGSWNVAWDVRPARWIHRPHNVWYLFGGDDHGPLVEINDQITCSSKVVVKDDHDHEIVDGGVLDKSNSYKVTGVPADGRCLFRAIAHMVCLRNGEEAPDENRQKELADELRVQVVDELMKRRKETEWFIEGDFDAYVKRIQKTFVWGGEPELLMASHVLKTTISVYMFEKDSNNLSKIATYGEEYEQSENSSIKVLFHGYGHYDILEDIL